MNRWIRGNEGEVPHGSFVIRIQLPCESVGKWSFLDEAGKIVVPVIYDSVQRDANGTFGKLKDKTVTINLPVIAESK